MAKRYRMSNGEGYPGTLAILNALTCAISPPYFGGMTDRLHKWRDDEIPKLSTTSDRKMAQHRRSSC